MSRKMVFSKARCLGNKNFKSKCSMFSHTRSAMLGYGIDLFSIAFIYILSTLSFMNILSTGCILSSVQSAVYTTRWPFPQPFRVIG